MDIAPMPPHAGVGFTSLQPLDDKAVKGYRYAPVGRYHNYHFTGQEFEWPQPVPTVNAKIDGFSPNLNKQLHIGHLRNLAVGSSLVKITGTDQQPVAMLGACLGELDGALDALKRWYAIAKYEPVIHKDTELMRLSGRKFKDGEGDQAGCKVWDGPKGPVIVYKSDGSSTYALHDLMFSITVAPTHYVTAIEQQGHFESLGLKEKHLPMGLVVGADNKKIKSRTGDAMLATEAMQMVNDSLKEQSDELAWNVLAWNFLSANRSQNVKFIPSLWANPDRGGLYISYTYARVKSALVAAGHENPMPFEQHPVYDPDDVLLMGYSSYFSYYLKRAREEMDPCPVAQYAFDLARKLGQAMEQRRVVGGSYSFQCAMWTGMKTLEHCMKCLTMTPLSKV